LEKYTAEICQEISHDLILKSPEALTNVVFFSQPVQTLLPFTYVQQGLEAADVIFIIPTNSVTEFSSSSYFTYIGNTDQAQEYYDTVSRSSGVLPIYTVESLRDNYFSWKADLIYDIRSILPVLGMIGITVFVNAFQTAQQSNEINRKRYAIRKTEGEKTISVIFHEVIVHCLLFSLTLLGLSLFSNLSLMYLVLLTLVLLMIDLLVLFSVTSTKTKNLVASL
jgi:hypothetical protein